MSPPDCGQPIRILGAVLFMFPLLVVRGQQDVLALSQVLFCQPGEPSSGLLKMFGEDQMFHYNFEEHSTSAWISDFEQWSDQAFPKEKNITSDLAFLKTFHKNLTDALEEILPEARGGTHVTVFTALPLRFGVPNTLICAIDDVYPPALTITWREKGNVLSTELNKYAYFSMADLSFQAVSYLNFTPVDEAVYSCDVQVAGDNRTIVAYWVPDYPVPSDIVENAFCGLGFILGILFLILGLVFLFLTMKSRRSD